MGVHTCGQRINPSSFESVSKLNFPMTMRGLTTRYAWLREWEMQIKPVMIKHLFETLREYPAWKAHVRNRGISAADEIEVAMVRDFSSHATTRLTLMHQTTGHGLYLHIPFCHQRCHFCAFYLEIYQARAAGAFLASLLTELRLYGQHNPFGQEPLGYDCFGGGTPTTLTPAIERGVIGG